MITLINILLARLCCPLYGDAHRIATEEILAPRLASNTATSTPRPQFAEIEDSEDEEEAEEEEEGEETMGHIKMKPEAPVNPVEELAKASSADVLAEGEVSIDLGDEKVEEEITTTTEKMLVQDKSVCQIKPSEGEE